MISLITESGPAMWAGGIVMGVVVLMPPLVWLIGLALAVRKSAPADRAEILRAYATLRLPTIRVGGREDGHNGAVDVGRLVDVGKTDNTVK